MLTGMTEDDWGIVLEVFNACRSRRGDKGRDDRKFLQALHYFTVHNITWRALPAEFGPWNSVWKRFWRLSQSGVFLAFFETLASLSETAHLVQMFDSTVIRAHVSAAGAKRGQKGEALGRSRGGFSTKIHLKTDLDGYPLGFHLTGGEASDSRNFEMLSISDPRSIQEPWSPTKAMMQKAIARRRVRAAFARSFPIARIRSPSPSFSPSNFTRHAPASSR